MNCQCKKFSTLETRPYGHKYAVNIGFEYITFRRKRCVKCNEITRTFELTENQAIALSGYMVKRKKIEKLLKEINILMNGMDDSEL